MPWYSPPTRRELSLVLFSLATFIVFFNLESSFSTITGDAPLRATKGHKPASGQVDWDRFLYGNWTWEEERVAANFKKIPVEALKDVQVSFSPQVFGTVGVNDGTLDWNDDVPTTTVLKHVPGYTILDNLFILNGTVFIVTDDPKFPSLGFIASSNEDPNKVPPPSDWQIISKAEARETLGTFGGIIHGVSWLVTDPSPSNYTLFSLWRTYSTLERTLSPDAPTLPPPRRIFYPNVYTFMDPLRNKPDNDPLRPRSGAGFHPFMAKVAFPTMGLMFSEDWADYALLHVPYLLKRVVVADSGAAHRARADVPPFAVPLLAFSGPNQWWEPIRRNAARFVDVAEQAPKKNSWLSKAEATITYLSRQDAAHGPKLRAADHVALVNALEGLDSQFTVHVVSSGAPWVERMTAIVQSTILVGVYGDQMSDIVFMPPSSRTTVMEIFPPGVFVQDAQVAAKALDMKYFAWWETQKFGIKGLPPVVLPYEAGNDEIPIDVPALIQAIKHSA